MPIDSLSVTFEALADPTRRAILERLADGEATLTQVAGTLPLSLQTVARHLAVLERAGLVVRTHELRYRPARLRGAPLRAAHDWLAGYHLTWADEPIAS